MMYVLVPFLFFSCSPKDVSKKSPKVSLDSAAIAEERLGIQSVLIPAGSFMMGCTPEDSDCEGDEKPRHKVTLTHGFYMMKSEVTQGLYQKVMGSNPSSFSSCGSDCPVDSVSWYDAVQFANNLSEETGLEKCYSINGKSVTWSNKDCKGWRLPTEAEWEYAARGGESYKYAGSNSLGVVAWYNDNSGSKTHEVCGKKKNGYGLCDMSGNVDEWVFDSYGGIYSSSETDPLYVDASSPGRVNRGGSWITNARPSRVSLRGGDRAFLRYGVYGFRLIK